MDTSKKHELQMSFQAVNPTVTTHPVKREERTVSELLQDSGGNCRQVANRELSLHLLSDSLFSEQQKLRHVLDWAHSFLSSGSETHQEFCRADSLILAEEEQIMHSSSDTSHHPICRIAGRNEVFGAGRREESVWQPSNHEKSESNNHLCACKPPVSGDSCIPCFCALGRDELTWPQYKETPENVKIMELQDSTNKQTTSQDANCRTSSLFISNKRHGTNSSNRSPNRTVTSHGARSLTKDSTPCWSDTCHRKNRVLDTDCNLKLSYETAAVQSERDTSGHQEELNRVEVGGEEKEETEVATMDERKVNEEQEEYRLLVHAKNKMSNSEPERTQEQMAQASNLTFSCHLKTPRRLTVFEQYQLYVDQLQRLRLRQSKDMELGCYKESLEEERKTSEGIAAPVEAPALPTPPSEFNSSTTNPEMKKRLHEAESQSVTGAEISVARSSDIMNRNQDSSKHKRYLATLGRGHTKDCDKDTPAAICPESRNTGTSKMHLDHDSDKCGELMKGTAGAVTSTDRDINRPMAHAGTSAGDAVPPVEESAALTANSGTKDLSPKTIRRNPDMKRRQRDAKGQNKKTACRGASQRLWEKSSTFWSSPNNKEILQRPPSSGGTQHTKRHTPEDKVKSAAVYVDTHKYLLPTEPHTPPHDDPRPASPASGGCQCEQTDCKYSPAGVPVCGRWLCLPDEVWLSILALLPLRDLCEALQVCSRLHRLATDHTLWRDLRIEKCILTDRWFLCVGRRRPRSLCLYSCCGASLTSCGLEMFFTLCRNVLEELKVTSCIGPGLHGDEMLRLIGQLCRHVTSVDVSWSGATDAGVKALSDCSAGLRLKSVVLNGCHVTDASLMKLVMKHKESLSRLEVFGCHFLTPSCLQSVYETCPGLQHLNIGQVPKISVHSLTVMASQLKCLISLNLAGLQAVTDATVDTLLQNCVNLQSLSLSSCPGVTDLTLHSISKYTPCIRSLDVSCCAAVTDAGVQSLALGCRRLQQLDLSSTGTRNRGVTLLANYCSRHLNTVKLSFCHITSENILKLCRRCKRLKVLHLYGCAHLPTEGEIRGVNTAVKVHPLP